MSALSILAKQSKEDGTVSTNVIAETNRAGMVSLEAFGVLGNLIFDLRVQACRLFLPLQA